MQHSQRQRQRRQCTRHSRLTAPLALLSFSLSLRSHASFVCVCFCLFLSVCVCVLFECGNSCFCSALLGATRQMLPTATATAAAPKKQQLIEMSSNCRWQHAANAATMHRTRSYTFAAAIAAAAAAAFASASASAAGVLGNAPTQLHLHSVRRFSCS